MNVASQSNLLETQLGQGFLTSSIEGNVLEHQTCLPTFDLHRVEEALLVNHRLFNGIGLTRDEARQAISEYRDFLSNHKAAGAPDQFEVPDLVVDRVWHTHMCETKQYSEDCMSYFGKILHHASNICNGGGGDGGKKSRDD